MTRYLKRVFDLLGSIFGLVLISPIVPIIMLAIKLDSKGPILFTQERIGLALPMYVKIFRVIKFRTMYVDAETNGAPQWAKVNDPRITKVGLFLRKTRMDELPQLINVLKGEMSLVGPRPERPGFYNKLENEIPFYVERTYGVTPGITGLAQVNQGYDVTIEDVRSKLAYDHAYALSLSDPLSWLKFESIILFKTLSVVLCGRGQ